MKKRATFAYLALAALLAGGSSCAWFRKPEDPLKRLISAQRRLVDGASAVKPAQASQMQAQAAEMQKLIDAANAGQQLDPDEVDRLIKRSYRQP